MNSKFRLWLNNIWFDNCAEHRDLGELPYTMQEYFQKYKYWLKREFRHQERREELKKPDPNLAIAAALDDKLDYTGSGLLSKSQNKLISTLKDNNEKQR